MHVERLSMVLPMLYIKDIADQNCYKIIEPRHMISNNVAF